MLHGTQPCSPAGYVGPGEVLASLEVSKANYPSRELLDAYLAGAGVLGSGTVEESNESWKVVLVTGDFVETRTHSENGITCTIAKPRVTVTSYAEAKYDTGAWDFDAADHTPEAMLKMVPKAVAAMAKANAKEKDGEVSKADLKLPFRHEDGTVSVAALRAVKSILGGGRGGVDLPADVKSKVVDEIDSAWDAWTKHQEKMRAKMTEAHAFAEADAVEIFEAGTYRGQAWTIEDLDEIAANFPAAGLDAPVVIGHDEDQTLLKSSGLPAAGWCEKVWRKGSKLMAKFRDMPNVVADLVNKKAYRKRSVEIYMDYSAGGKLFGKVLRRVALLGGEMPQVKTLQDFQALYCADSPEGKTVIVTFEEATMPEVKTPVTPVAAVTPIVNQSVPGTPAVPPAPEAIVLKTPEVDLQAFAEQVATKVRGEFAPQIVKLQEQLAEKEASIKIHAEKFQAAEARALRLDVEQFAADMRRQGKLTPAECVGIVEFMESLHSANTVVKYSEGDKAVENTLVGYFRDQIRKREPVVPVPGAKDHLPDDVSPSVLTPEQASKRIAKMAEDLSKTEKIQMGEAILRVAKAHPELEAARSRRK